MSEAANPGRHDLEVGFVIPFEDGLARGGASYASHAEALAAAEEMAA